jgi:hypothetical protein
MMCINSREQKRLASLKIIITGAVYQCENLTATIGDKNTGLSYPSSLSVL